MRNSIDLNHCDVRLQYIFKQAKAIYEDTHPEGPTLSIAEARRNKTTQTSRFKQGLGNAQFGQSPQNYEVSRALKWRLTDKDNQEVTDLASHTLIWQLLQQVSEQLRTPLRWGGNWGNPTHVELLYWRMM